MRVFFAGASGVIGPRCCPRLLEAGHEVVALTRTPAKAEGLAAAGAEPVVCDVLDAAALRDAVVAARPEAVIHHLTDLPQEMTPDRDEGGLEATNRVRTEGTANLLDAAREAGARRVVAQSIAFAYAPRPTRPPRRVGPAVRRWPHARRRDRRRGGRARAPGHERARGSRASSCASASGTGPGPRTPPTAIGPRRSGGGGCRSSATAPRCGRSSTSTTSPRRRSPRSSAATPGVYNVTDDDPAAAREWVPAYAEAVGREAPAAGADAARADGRRPLRRLPLARTCAAPRTRRRSASSASSRAGRAGGRGSWRRSDERGRPTGDARRRAARARARDRRGHALERPHRLVLRRRQARPAAPARLPRDRAAGGRPRPRARRECDRRADDGRRPDRLRGAGATGADSELVAFFVRKERKEHGLQRWVEGPLLGAGTPCLVVEDVVTTGGSTVKAIERIREEGLDIRGTVSILDRLAGGGGGDRGGRRWPLRAAGHHRRHLPGPARVGAPLSRPGGCGSSGRRARSSARRRRCRSARCAARSR